MRILILILSVFLFVTGCSDDGATDAGSAGKASPAGDMAKQQTAVEAVEEVAVAIEDAGAADGKAKTMVCAACHGQNGISMTDIWPNLAGQKKGYLIKQIRAFRDGQRVDPSMMPMVKSLSDQDIEDIAGYYAGLPRS
jgi:cytochrome c553